MDRALRSDAPTTSLPGAHVVAVLARSPLFWILAALALGAAAGVLLSPRPGPGDGADRMSSVALAPLTADAGVSESPAFSPDGETVAYASDRSGDFEIYLRRASGGGDVNVTNHPGDDVQPSFSPDGRLLAFVSTRSSRRTLTRINPDQEPTGGDLWVVPPLGGEARLVARDGNFPVFAPDSRALYFVGGEERHNQVFRVGPDGGTPQAVLGQAEAQGEYRRLSISRDGRWLVGLGGLEVAVEVVRGHRQIMVGLGRDLVRLAALGLQAAFAHQAPYTVATDSGASLS